jgi:type II secretory pathway pseudopilin PulG
MRVGVTGTALGVEQRRRGGEAGFTLVEIVVVVAIVVTTALAGVAISLGSRSFAVATAASEFDHIVDSARTIARETQGATLLFAPDVFGDGTEVRVVTPGPNGALSPTTVPTLHTRAAIEESESLGKAPFAFVVHATGALGGRPGYRTGPPNTIPEVGCPPSGWFHFLIHAAGATAERTLPCRTTLAATAPYALATWPPAPTAPLPTPCATAPCTPWALPTPPSSSPTCPPNFVATSAGCAPSSATGSAPHYHVTASLALPKVTVGAIDSITGQATLTNASVVPAGTPLNIPLEAQTDANCSLSPKSQQGSTTTFNVVALSVGTCSIAITADTTTIAGATSDSATLSIDVSSLPTGTPTPPSCDLLENGTCYNRLVGPTDLQFEKDVLPDTACGDVGESVSCWYINSVKQITLTPYSFTPPTPPDAQEHELFFRITKIVGLTYGCLPYQSFASVPGGAPIPYLSTGVGAPVNAPSGFAEPSVYAHQNFVTNSPPGVGTVDDTATSKNVNATLDDLIAAIALRTTGSDYTFTYFSSGARLEPNINWFPDFPGCDAVGDPYIGDPQYGYSAVTLEFEIYQRVI